jgi:hypothetical protein
MVDQAQVEPGRGATQRGDSPQRAVARNTAEFLHDVLTLVELQASLLKIDVRQCLAGLVVPGVALIVGAMLLLSCLPILLASVALLLVETLEWTYAQAFFCSLGIGLLLGGIACLAGAVFVRRSFQHFERSRSEFVQNLSWIKHVLKRLGTSPKSPERWNGH